jgi:dihydrofolate reductase
MSGFFKSVDVAVMGRKTYNRVLELASKELFPPSIKTYVFSRSKPARVLDGITFVNDSIAVWVESIRAQPGKDIWLVGGGELVRAFLRKRLVNEIRLTIHPRLLGDGIALFSTPYPETELKLLRCEEYKSGLVQISYEVRSSSTTSTKSDQRGAHSYINPQPAWLHFS